MKHKFKLAFMKAAEVFAELSHARRLKVGAIIVRQDRMISLGYNGTPTGWDNNCEDEEYTYDERDTYHSSDWNYDEDTKRYVRLKTKPEVLHAEMNALMKLARSSESGDGATMFITHAPCMDCAKGIFQAGIKQVFYKTNYRDTAGLDFLIKCGVTIEQVSV